MLLIMWTITWVLDVIKTITYYVFLFLTALVVLAFIVGYFDSNSPFV